MSEHLLAFRELSFIMYRTSYYCGVVTKFSVGDFYFAFRKIFNEFKLHSRLYFVKIKIMKFSLRWRNSLKTAIFHNSFLKNGKKRRNFASSLTIMKVHVIRYELKNLFFQQNSKHTVKFCLEERNLDKNERNFSQKILKKLTKNNEI
jgi:hypothetical protein